MIVTLQVTVWILMLVGSASGVKVAIGVYRRDDAAAARAAMLLLVCLGLTFTLAQFAAWL